MAELRIQRTIDAPRALLWTYLSTPLGLACWQADHVEGGLEEGSFSLRWPQLGARLDLSVAEIERERSLVLRAGDHKLAMVLNDTAVQLQHGGLHEDDDLIGLESSWNTALSLLDIAVTAHPQKPRAVHWLFQPVQASAELAHYYFTDARGLGQWLGESRSSLSDSTPFAIDCDGTHLSGVVQSCERDVCLRVEELQAGALTFRTLPAPQDQRVVAVGVSSWETPPEESLLEMLQAALVRFARITERAHG